MHGVKGVVRVKGHVCVGNRVCVSRCINSIQVHVSALDTGVMIRAEGMELQRYTMGCEALKRRIPAGAHVALWLRCIG